MTDLEALAREASGCTACRLFEGRTKVVFGEGDPASLLLLVGEAPGRDEDASGRPFVGAAGRLLDRILESVGFRREDVYITNTVMCRPPQNRQPAPDEQAACRFYLDAKMALVAAPMVVTLGASATKALLGDPRAAITKLRGQRISRDGHYIYPTFHPAALLRDPSKKRPVWEDFKRIRRDYDLLSAQASPDGGG